MAKHIRISLENEEISMTARLLEKKAPETSRAVWNNLPVTDDVHHAKWAGRELYTLVPPFDDLPGTENATITPIPGDICYFFVHSSSIDLPVETRERYPDGLVDLAVFYGRNNLLIGPEGAMPGNVFARAVDNLDEFADACARLFREGYADETLRFERAPGYEE